ncbi:hypothetical protein [Nocardia jiangxiensis]|uniref:hypothetical protein n=1 Tax=Nocardia jiangxiensis TaxID=282685 RepID=UPI0012F64A5F
MISYTLRLGAANDMAYPVALLRAVGNPVTYSPSRTLVSTNDVLVNEAAQQRLAAFTGIDLAHLRQRLPTLRRSFDEPDPAVPAIRCFAESAAPRKHCDRCIAQMPGHPRIVVHRNDAHAICQHHRRWIDTSHFLPDQIDPTRTPAIIAAHYRYRRLAAAIRDPPWVREQLWWADRSVARWCVRPGFGHLTQLRDRWQRRTTAIGHTGWTTPTTLIALPETIALLELFCDLSLRRHIAMVEYEFQIAPFYYRISQRLGQPRRFAELIGQPGDAVHNWVQDLRAIHRETRQQFWNTLRATGSKPQLPAIDQFQQLAPNPADPPSPSPKTAVEPGGSVAIVTRSDSPRQEEWTWLVPTS